MKTCIVPLIVVALLSACTTQQVKPPVPLSDQDDLNCKSYGITAGMIAQRRDNGLSEQDAIADVQHEFTKINVSMPRDRIAKDFAESQFSDIAGAVYAARDYNPKTILFFFPTLCLAKLNKRTDKDVTAFIYNEALSCQRLTPLDVNSQRFDVHNAATLSLQACIREVASGLFGTKR
jgi:hypothetical protein